MSWYTDVSTWAKKPPELLPESARKPIGADYFHQLPSSKHPWQHGWIGGR